MAPPPPPPPPPPPKASSLSKAAAPVLSKIFDPWNSSSTGHQRPENRPGTGWRESRHKKLNSQFQGGSSGGVRLSDTWGEGSEDWDDREKVVVPKSIKQRRGNTVIDLLQRAAKPSTPTIQSHGTDVNNAVTNGPASHDMLMQQPKDQGDETEAHTRDRRLFDGVVAFVNGSTFPLVSDHKLKQIITENGGQMSLHLGRRRVTHVVLGRTAGSGTGAGGGLAGSKLDREIRKQGGSGAVKFVNAEWVLESLKVGKRLPEARFSAMRMASSGQATVYSRYSAPSAHEAAEKSATNKP
ncbi:hypothetical protein B0I35DRAFT_474695 [Stachybotrys elegans]|uniref:BRCT domain-containing protein n=1 Tax=Stachybotrys elegans TaxID=80388 RepID=A0A8K0SZ96_9HYPO|nr:hypothetical protein B0I35DRAFT_474695 [Stachybotrys elegans]